MDTFKYNEIKEKYGVNTIRLIKELESISLKIGRSKSHLRFNLQCKHTDIIPKYLKLKSPIKGNLTRNVLHAAEKSLLNIRIKELNEVLRQLAIRKSATRKKILNTLPEAIANKILEINTRRESNSFDKARDRQKEKYYKLRYGDHYKIATNHKSANKVGPEEIKKWVKNISSKELTDDQLSLLARGSGFAIAPQKLPIEEIIVSTELACMNLPRGESTAMRAEVAQVLEESKKKPIHSNLTLGERKALKELKDDPNITIVPADKGKCIVVMDTTEYNQKMLEKLNDLYT